MSRSAARGMDTARNRLLCGGDKSADEFRLADSPAGQRRVGDSAKSTADKQEDWQGDGDEFADRGSGKHPGTQDRIADGAEVEPVAIGSNEDASDSDRNCRPE